MKNQSFINLFLKIDLDQNSKIRYSDLTSLIIRYTFVIIVTI